MSQPNLETTRLILRPFTLADAPTVQRLASAYEVASTTLNIPHPYPDGAAEQWISTHAEQFKLGTNIALAMVLRETDELCGAINMRVNQDHRHAELGYWLGLPYWNKGYTTEAAAALLKYGFTELQLHRIFAHHLTRNPASGRVMQKIGMTFEGILREQVLKWGQFEDIATYGILHREWQTAYGSGLTSELRIRQVTPADLDRCFAIESACYGPEGATRDRIERRINLYPQGFLVAEVDGQVIGFVNSGATSQTDLSDEALKDMVGHEAGGQNLVIFSLAVHPEFQGQGISRELMVRFVEVAKGLKKDKILLLCKSELVPYYERYGFIHQGASQSTHAGMAWQEMDLSLA